MKKLLLLLLLMQIFSVHKANAQWVPSLTNHITFDSGDTIYQHAIIIDTVDCHHNIWKVGKPQKTIFDSSYSFPNAIVTDTVNPYPPNDTSMFLLAFPGARWADSVFGVSDWGVLVQFFYQLNIDANTRLKIEFSSDSGATWSRNPTSFLLITGPDSMGTMPGWQSNQFSFEISYHDSTICRFTFISGNDTSGKEGWMIDNMLIYYYPVESVQKISTDNLLSLFPNPVSSTLAISSSHPINQIIITNLLGQNVRLIEGNQKLHVQVDVSKLPTGMYFRNVNGTEIRRFIKE